MYIVHTITRKWCIQVRCPKYYISATFLIWKVSIIEVHKKCTKIKDGYSIFNVTMLKKIFM